MKRKALKRSLAAVGIFLVVSALATLWQKCTAVEDLYIVAGQPAGEIDSYVRMVYFGDEFHAERGEPGWGSCVGCFDPKDFVSHWDRLEVRRDGEEMTLKRVWRWKPPYLRWLAGNR